jgi:adenosylhomocysteine nucleosidase
MSILPHPRPVFVAALTREIAGLVAHRGWRAEPKLLARNIHLFEHEDAILVCAGMGTDRVALAVQAAFALGPASELISVGWAGACNSDLSVGDIVHADIVVDARTGERYVSHRAGSDGKPALTIVTVSTPAGTVEKRRLHSSYMATAVEMEAAAVARLAGIRGVPFHAIKAISDAADFELPGMERFSAPDGQFREAAFGLYVAFRPALWKAVVTMARGSNLAATRLQAAIKAHIDEQKRRKL